MAAGHLIYLLFRTLGAIFGAALFALFYALRVKNTAKDVIANAWKVFHTTTADKNY
jgi:glycerol uptake facilitator-like aquaporin